MTHVENVLVDKFIRTVQERLMRFKLIEAFGTPIIATMIARDAEGRVIEKITVQVDPNGYFELEKPPKHLPLYAFAKMVKSKWQQ